MAPSFRLRCTCGALILAAVAGGIVHHDAESHTETFRPDPAPLVISTVAGSTSSSGASTFVLNAEPGRYTLTGSDAGLSVGT